MPVTCRTTATTKIAGDIGRGIVVRDGAGRRTAARCAPVGTGAIARFLDWLAGEARR